LKREPASAGRSVRTLRVGEAMRHALADILARTEFGDPALDGHIISVSEVRVSPDLRHAIVFILPVGEDAAGEKAALAALRSHARRLRHELAERVNLKYAAELQFRVDDSFAEAARIDRLMRRPEVARDIAPPQRAGEADAD
jgi:ribosome-binding factor A